MKVKEVEVDKRVYRIAETNKVKRCSSDDYNYVFKKDDGFFARWGRTHKDDPECAPFPEILDFEVSSVVESLDKFSEETHHITKGCCCGVGCDKFCYKGSYGNNLYKIEYDDGTVEVKNGNETIEYNGNKVKVCDINIE